MDQNDEELGETQMFIAPEEQHKSVLLERGVSSKQTGKFATVEEILLDDAADTEFGMFSDSERMPDWKPAKFQSYEVMGLTSTKLNPSVRPCGFLSNGKNRMIKKTCLLSRVKKLCMLRDTTPKLAVCITMYNENEAELKTTIAGVLQNYNAMSMDPDIQMKQQDLIVVCVCDGFDKIPESFKQYATKNQFLDIEILKEKGFMYEDRDGSWKMKTMPEIMDKGVKKIPKNILHLFQVCTLDFGLDDESLKGRRINFIFALKQRNDGKINSHKWFYQGICKYLKPEFAMMLDIGTRADDYAITKLYKYMMNNPNCGGCCGEIEVDFSTHKEFDLSYILKSAQYYEYKLSHSPDKCCESFFGYNSVLPGAYCMFRWRAIQGGPMDSFFKLVNSDVDPTCGEANEYLAEDRVMCLQIYIKKNCGYYLTYIPDAKAFTDAPENLTILIKQRRRWTNGALFAAYRVIANFYKMTRCESTRHGVISQFFMIIYMTYFLTLQILSFFLIGSFYVSIKLFFVDYFKQLTDSPSFMYNNIAIYKFFNGGSSTIGFETLFSFGYAAMLMFTVFISIAAPIDRAIFYFRIVSSVFSVLTILSIIGIATFLTETGFYPPVKQYNVDTAQWIDLDEPAHFSILTLSGVVMLSIYLVPIILRPKDFFFNMKQYFFGLFSYFLLLPVFINVMQVYAMSNLHDISWGNRPSVNAGTNALSADDKKQQQLKSNYQVFRVNFMMFWVVSNLAFVIVIENYSTMTNQGGNVIVNNGQIGFLEVYAIYLAALVLYKVFFGGIHILKFKFLFTFNPKYKIYKFEMLDQVKILRMQAQDWNNSEQDWALLEKSNETRQTNHMDNDDDDMEFEDAKHEENIDISKQLSVYLIDSQKYQIKSQLQSQKILVTS